MVEDIRTNAGMLKLRRGALKTKRVVVIGIVIGLLVVGLLVRGMASRQQAALVKAVDKQLFELFAPLVDSTIIYVDGQEYHLRTTSARLWINEEYYAQSNRSPALVQFDIYEGARGQGEKLTSARFGPYVHRDTREEKFYPQNNVNPPGSWISNLFHEFVGAYHEEKYGRWMSAQGSYDEHAVEFDFWGNVTKPGEVVYSLRVDGRIYETSFYLTEENEDDIVLNIELN